MAISKILHMKDSGNSFHARHLKRALDYVMNPEKTQGGRLVGAINCQADMAFEQMMDTKKQFGKTDKRQGYHIILSFKEDEVEPDRAFEITQKFVAEYLGDAYEAVFVVHDNTDHVHSHIVFNSVSFVDGKKYRYEKSDTTECAKQSKYIHEFVKRKEYSIVGKMRRNGFSQRDVDRQWNQIVNMIRKKQISGVVVANMAAISSSVADAYFKVGLVIEAGGIVVTVDEGKLDMHIKKGA